jgi:hypothetical protein
MIVLPVIAFLLFYLVLHKMGIGERRAFLAAATFSGTSVVVITELLSAAGLVTRGGVAASWLAISLLGLALYLKIERPVDVAIRPGSEVQAAERGLDGVTKALLVASGIIAVLVGITALLAPPSNIDAMAYHLPRVVMWINNHNVRFFPTANYTQIIYGAFAEYSIMHTILLWGSDRFTNMIQFFCFLGCPVAVSYIVKLVGGSPRTQALAAVICLTVPEGILEASGPMTTYSSAFWIVTATAFLFAFNEDAGWLNTVCIGLASGLAIFAKGTTYFFLPFIVLASWWVGSKASRIAFLKRSVVFIALILVINTPQYLRNYQFDGSPLGVPLDYGAVQFTIEDKGVRSTLANIIRNISLHAGSPVDSLNGTIEHGFRKAIQIIGVDPDDPRQVIWGQRFRVNHLSFNELVAGNPLHLMLLLAAMAIIFVKSKRPENRILVWYSLGLVEAFVVFCALLKWQMWTSRYHLPFFVLGAVVIAMALTRYVPRRIVAAIAILLVTAGVINGSMNRFRSLVPVGRWLSAYGPRPTLYFAYENEYLAPSYIAAADAVNKTDCKSVGIDSYTPLSDPEITRAPESFFTYPILALIHADGRTRTAWFSGVHNLTARYAQTQPHPAACAIVCLYCAKVPAKWEEYSSFRNHAVFDNTVVFTDARTNVD